MIKLHTIFLLGYVAPSLHQKDYVKATSNWTENDMKYLLDLLSVVSSSSDLTVSRDDMTLSAEDIVSNILNLVHFSQGCFTVVCQPKLIQPCILLLQKGTDCVKQLTCQLLWELLLSSKNDDASFRDTIISESKLKDEIDLLSNSINADMATISRCLKIVLQQEKVDLGMYVCVHMHICT